MYSVEDRNQRIRHAQKKLIPNLIINLILPWLLYVVLRPHFTNDTIPLAISAIIPTIKTIVQWVSHRRFDWIGFVSITILAIALIVTYLSGGSALPLKLIQPAIFGLIGLVFLGSVLVGRPLLVIMVGTFRRQNNEHFNNPLMLKKLTIMTALFGGVSLIGALTHIVTALILPTSAFLAVNNLISIAIIAALILFAKVIVPKIK
ncbi:VC0807 family protein [Desulfosporosinus sp. Sb-LF]|uniref:VC0807 family protein n=1 Tax=Desulfosporosinus sp. Sb-LF TaxID=2560027 RepID=UPI00107F6E1C|nr:VC0807 family protein [Desulfosporosinus sp. Sb-LF]TGE33871.1 hypothetical protein E4K68_03375 [Desulfosporosinus sp. Sb-LF]